MLSQKNQKGMKWRMFVEEEKSHTLRRKNNEQPKWKEETNVKASYSSNNIYVCVCVCDIDRVGVWKMRITIDRRERLPRVHVKGNGDSSCDDDRKLCRCQPSLRYVWPASLFRWKQNDSKPQSNTTIVKSWSLSCLRNCVALNAIVTSSLLHFTFPPTFQRPARNRSARTRPKRDETIFLSLVTRFSLLHFSNVLTICFSAHKVDDEIWIWFHWISLEYYFILSWKKYCSEFSWALFRSTFEENIVSTIINDA